MICYQYSLRRLSVVLSGTASTSVPEEWPNSSLNFDIRGPDSCRRQDIISGESDPHRENVIGVGSDNKDLLLMLTTAVRLHVISLVQSSVILLVSLVLEACGLVRKQGID